MRLYFCDSISARLISVHKPRDRFVSLNLKVVATRSRQTALGGPPVSMASRLTSAASSGFPRQPAVGAPPPPPPAAGGELASGGRRARRFPMPGCSVADRQRALRGRANKTLVARPGTTTGRYAIGLYPRQQQVVARNPDRRRIQMRGICAERSPICCYCFMSLVYVAAAADDQRVSQILDIQPAKRKSSDKNHSSRRLCERDKHTHIDVSCRSKITLSANRRPLRWPTEPRKQTQRAVEIARGRLSMRMIINVNLKMSSRAADGARAAERPPFVPCWAAGESHSSHLLAGRLLLFAKCQLLRPSRH